MRPKWTVDNTFSVSSHIQGRKVTITVYESERTIEVSGPGHKLWKDIALKRISTTLFARFLKNCGIDLQGSINYNCYNSTTDGQYTIDLKTFASSGFANSRTNQPEPRSK